MQPNEVTLIVQIEGRHNLIAHIEDPTQASLTDVLAAIYGTFDVDVRVKSVTVAMPHGEGAATVVAAEVDLSPAEIASHLWGDLCDLRY